MRSRPSSTASCCSAACRPCRVRSFAAPLLQAVLHIAAVALGIAEGALADLTEFAATKKRRLYGPVALPDSPIFQHKLGHAEADAFAARALLRDARRGALGAGVRGRGRAWRSCRG